MPKFCVDFTYSMCGTVVVEAEDRESAEDVVDNMPLADLDADYMDDSFEFINNNEE